MRQRNVEIGVGLFVLAGMAALLVLALQVSNLSSFGSEEGYEVSANFANTGSLRPGAAVTMAGVRVGRVTSIGIDKTNYEARVTMNITSQHDDLPSDTSASILTAGLLGEQYIGLEAGGADETLKNGSEIKLTQSALVLEQIIGQFLFNVGGQGKNE